MKKSMLDFVDRFPPLHAGIRTLSMLWIILGHSVNFMMFVGFDEPLSPVVLDKTLNAAGFHVSSQILASNHY